MSSCSDRSAAGERRGEPGERERHDDESVDLESEREVHRQAVVPDRDQPDDEYQGDDSRPPRHDRGGGVPKSDRAGKEERDGAGKRGLVANDEAARERARARSGHG